MSKAKMKFPAVLGTTPRERFENLVRHVISVPKAELDSDAAADRRQRRRRAAKRRMRS
jgi:hypothetical protein